MVLISIKHESFSVHSNNSVNQQVTIEKMTQNEVDLAIQWAHSEGWNPGIHDAYCFYHADPDGFYAVKVNGEIVGTVSVVKYSEDFAFAGLYIVRPDFRGKGIGLVIAQFVERKFGDLTLGLDGVVSMQKHYEKDGFSFAHNNTRYAGIAKGTPSNRCLPIRQEDFAEVAAFDSNFFPAKRSKFLECWLFQKDAHAFMIRKEKSQNVCGYGVIRKCFTGHKIGPLFADDAATAELLLNGLSSTVSGEEVFLDVPEPNAEGIELAKKQGMKPVFSTVRMYTKTAPVLPLNKIYGITSFELG